MSGLCKLLGHKWKGCVCVRCGQSRNKKHIWQFSAVASSRIHPIQCREKCELCGMVRDANHRWDGCVCSGCGRRRDSGHKLEPVRPLKCFPSYHAFSSQERSHGAKCSRCNQIILSEHRFKPLPGCRRRCTECGYEGVWHNFKDGICQECGISEEQYFLDLILSGTVKYSENINENDYGKGTYGDFVRSEEGILRVAKYYVKSRYDNFTLSSVMDDVCEKLGRFVKQSGDAKSPVERMLYDIACNDDIPPGVRDKAFDKIAAPMLKAKAKAKMDKYYETHKTQAEIDRENTLIAMDSGLGRSG